MPEEHLKTKRRVIVTVKVMEKGSDPDRFPMITRADTVGDVIDALLLRHGTLRSRIGESRQQLHANVVVRLNGTDIRYAHGQETWVRGGDVIEIDPDPKNRRGAVLTSIAVAAAVGSIAWRSGFASPLISTWLLLAAAGVATVLIFAARVGRHAWSVERFGFVALAFVFTLVAVASVWRLTDSVILQGIMVPLFAVAALAIALIPDIRLDKIPTRIGTIGAVMGAFALASIVVSIGGCVRDGATFGTSGPTAETLAAERARRQRLLAGREVTPIAIALSGGGYRAAAVEAGMMSVFERANLPIAYLSTVSGGSIFGAAYALGWTPEQFVGRLKRGRPYLIDDFTRPWVPSALLSGDWGTGDVLREHLARVYFQEYRLDDTGPPVLIINTTDYRSGDRVAFWSGDENPRPQSRELATVVAASAAFPGAFSPVRVGVRDLIDGGVFENFGVEGLRQYLDTLGSNARTPSVLIICDVSAPLGTPDGRPSLASSAWRAINIQGAARGRDLLARYLDDPEQRKTPVFDREEFDRMMRVFGGGVPASRFWIDRGDDQVSVFRVSLEWAFSADDKEQAAFTYVSGFSTLSELTPEQVDAAFTVGQTLALRQLPDICRAARLDCAAVLRQ